MSLTVEIKTQVDHVATDALDVMDRVATLARVQSRKGIPGSDAFAAVNTMTATLAVQNLQNAAQANQDANRVLADEPAIARVVVENEDGERRTYYICRTTPVTGSGVLLASYKSPVGRLAALPIGGDLRLPNGDLVEVVERLQLRPVKHGAQWDSQRSVYEGERAGPLTIESLRALLRQVVEPEVVEDLLAQVMATAAAAENISEGKRRSIITKMGLRDQPILDQYQDEIFRLPLNQRLLILGPPGTGKTTTLIRRLGQKLDSAELPEDEQRVIASASQSTGLAHEQSWLMFTPTELLKQYLKEAFNRENVAAPDQRLKTWADYRRDLARNTLGLIRSGNSKGFSVKDTVRTLSPEAEAQATDLYADFDASQRRAYVSELQQSAQVLADSKQGPTAALGARLLAMLKASSPSAMPDLFLDIASEVDALQRLVTDLKTTTDQQIQGSLNLAMNREKGFLDELGKLMDQLKQAPEAETDDGDDADDAEGDEEDVIAPKTGTGAAINAYQRAVRAQARAAANKRSIGKTTNTGKILDWLGERTLPASARANVGTQLLLQKAAHRFTNPLRRYLNALPARYRAFRRDAQEIGLWYRPDGFQPNDLHPLELDVLMLASLRAAGDMLSRPTLARRTDEGYWQPLKTVQGLYRHQILVDEATDFSPIQLACMAALAHPQLRSFFACGDFNQRLTTWGSRSMADMNWVLPDLAIREVSVTYRQSRQLNELARAIIQQLGGTESHVSLPPHVDSEGLRPALLEDTADTEGAVSWLADRIVEIEQTVEQLPSTAIFVNSEQDVQPLADALNEVLEDRNVRVVACPKGQVMGQENDVRVFDIQHIKGLEFEAVFFVGIDRLAASQPALFDKYLYVGTTRAATYLGLTCDGALPAAMEALRPHFAADWAPA